MSDYLTKIIQMLMIEDEDNDDLLILLALLLDKRRKERTMPRNRTRTTTKASWTVDSLENAVSVLKRGGISVYKVSQQTGIPYSTLKKRYNLAKADDSSYKNSPKLGRRTLFNVAQEEILANHLRTMSSKFYGLTREQFRKVCYSVAKELSIEKRFNQVNQTAGKDWLAGFLQRHPDLSIRKPEAISINRILGFNKTEITLFFNNLEKLMEQHNFEPQMIYNVDETGITTVQETEKIIAPKAPLHLTQPAQNQDSPSSGNEIKVFCPKCNTEVPHTAEGIQEDQTKILIAKVYHYFEHEYEELKKMYGDLDLSPLSKFRQRTALATGVSETTVLQILNEEEGRNADNRQEPPKKRRIARKRSRQTDSSSEEDSSDYNVDDVGESSFFQVAEKEPEIETLVVKLEPVEYYKEQPQTDPISVQVKAEPPDDDDENANETFALNEPAGAKRKPRKIPKRSDVTSTQQHKQGEPSTTAAASSVPLTDQLYESGLLEATEVKLEKIEIGEEGFS